MRAANFVNCHGGTEDFTQAQILMHCNALDGKLPLHPWFTYDTFLLLLHGFKSAAKCHCVARCARCTVFHTIESCWADDSEPKTLNPVCIPQRRYIAHKFESGWEVGVIVGQSPFVYITSLERLTVFCLLAFVSFMQ
jgi:hypothetical protein